MGRIFDDENWELLKFQGPPSDLGPGIFPRLTTYGSRAAKRFGLLPSTEFVKPIPQADWKEFIAHCHAEKIFPMYHRKASSLEQKPSQDGTNFCWAWSARAALENARLLAGMPATQLAPISLGWLVNWSNAGNYLDVTVKGLRERGIASEQYCPEPYDFRGRSFKSGWEQDGLNYRLGEVWDVDRSAGIVWTIGQTLAILGTGTTLYCAWNRLSHAMDVDGMTWDESQKYGVIWNVFNSHSDGAIQMAGDSAVPDELYGFRAPSLPGV